jgi:hypothetical protein
MLAATTLSCLHQDLLVDIALKSTGGYKPLGINTLSDALRQLISVAGVNKVLRSAAGAAMTRLADLAGRSDEGRLQPLRMDVLVHSPSAGTVAELKALILMALSPPACVSRARRPQLVEAATAMLNKFVAQMLNIQS